MSNLFEQNTRYEPEPNHFSDDDPLPAMNTDAKEASSIRLAIKTVPERPAVLASESISEFPVLVGLRAPLLSKDASMFKRAPIDLVTVLDVSGSMDGSVGKRQGTKLDLVKQAVLFVIDNLGPSDRLSIVSFSTNAKRILRLKRMTDDGRQAARQAVNSLRSQGSTNIVRGLKKGVQVLEERREKNPVASIIFLSDGEDTDNHYGRTYGSRSSGEEPQYLHLLPASIHPRDEAPVDDSQQQIFPVHAFGFGSDHDPIAMHAIADSSGGTFSFIESLVMVQDAFANCIGGLLSVVMQDLRLTVRAAAHGVEIKSIPSGRYGSKISNNGSDGVIDVGDMYAEEEREFLIYLSIPKLPDMESGDKMSILDITCRYKDAVSEETAEMQADLVEIRRPEFVSPVDTVVSREVDRQRNRLLVSESIAEAQRKADSRDLTGAQAVLSNARDTIVQSVSGQAGDKFCAWLESEIIEAEQRMANMKLYEESGRAFLMAGKIAHASQRAGGVAGEIQLRGALVGMRKTAKNATGGNAGGSRLPLLSDDDDDFTDEDEACCGSSDDDMGFSLGDDEGCAYAGGYTTRFMADMVQKSREVTKTITKNEDKANISNPQLSEVDDEFESDCDDEEDDDSMGFLSDADDMPKSEEVTQMVTKDNNDSRSISSEDSDMGF